MKDQAIDPVLQHLRQAMNEVETPSSLQAKLMQAFDQQRKPVAVTRRGWLPRFWIPSAVMLSALLMAWLAQPELDNHDAPPALVQMEQDAEDMPFIALTSKEAILQQEQVRIVRADVPNSVLATMGVGVSPQLAAASSRAEMLVNERNEYLAVRFVR